MKETTQKDIINKIYNDDARNILNILGEKVRIKSTITSPPYFDMKDYGSENQIGFGQNYDEYLEDLKNIFKNIFDITDEDGSLWIIIDSFKRNNQVVTLPFDLSNKLKEVGWLLQDIIIWKKDKTVPWSKNGFVQRKFEYILFLTKTKNFKYNKDGVRNYDTDQLKKWWIKYPERYNPKGKALDEIWEFPIPVQGSWGDKYIRHFCPLPKEMVATMIEISTDKNDLVLDPFAGTGSVPFQSAIMQRNFIGFELNNNFIKMFDDYFKENKSKAEKEFKKLLDIKNQDDFKNQILNLRALKYGRLLVNEIEKKYLIETKVVVQIKENYEDEKTHILVEYQFLNISDEMKEDILNFINLTTNKAPFSKFGIKHLIKFPKKKNIINKDYFTYTKTNSYSYSKLEPNSNKVKVLSEICVNLDEKDYS